ncbi:MAG: D-glycerate dehydrogenase [Alphaproteobacteria bacterium]|nr:D-glycerate dehydrogenase [Alphaproteobacteria bacterium]
MTKNKLSIFITRKLPDITETLLFQDFNCSLNLQDRPLSREEILDAMCTNDVLVPTISDRIDGEMLNQAAEVGKLRMIALFGTGVDHIDLLSAHRLGIPISNTPDVLTEDTADMAMALILAVPRRLIKGENLLRSGQWQGWSPTAMLGHRIWGKKLGIIGMGRIGQALARRAAGFDMEIHYHNRNRLDLDTESTLKATFHTSLDHMLSQVDVVSVHCPHTPATYHLINQRRLKLLHPHAVVINTSRGEIIEEDALIKALKRQEIAGAGLDVFEHEEHLNPAWLKIENAVLLPHMGSATIEGRESMGDKVLKNIQAFSYNMPIPDLVETAQF